jgi:hypothetical protein
VERLLTENGLHPVVARAELRLEAGAPVDGLVVRAEKCEAGNHAARGLQPPRSNDDSLGAQHV